MAQVGRKLWCGRGWILGTLLALALVACDSGEPRPQTLPPVEAEATATRPAVDLTMPQTEADEFAEVRSRMVEQHIAGMEISDEAVIAAMEAVPRHRFVPDQYLSQAHGNHPLPIGFGQTISQPYVVALMTEAALVDGDDVVLEIGSGSGYQAAVLAEIVQHVYTVEIIGALAERAETTLQELGYQNVSVRHADGYFGWEEHAPYDAIVVTAAPDHIPQPLVDQLKVGAHMIIPVGPVGGFQTLWRVTKVSEEEVRTQDLGGVMFVPLTREEQE